MTENRWATKRDISGTMTLPAHDLEGLELGRYGRRMTAFNPSEEMIDELVAFAARELGQAAPVEVVRRINRQNPDSLWAFRARNAAANAENLKGFIAFLMLSEAGVKALLRDEFDGFNPAPHHVVAQHEKPAGIYIWLLHARGTMIPGIAVVMEKLRSPHYIDVDFFGWAPTEDGHRFMRAIGFSPGASRYGLHNDKIYNYVRYINRERKQLEQRPIYNSYKGDTPSEPGRDRSIGVKVVRTLEEFMMMTSVRSATYLAEQSCPYGEEFDGNDFSATHLLGFIGDEPAGALRIRYFADFCKLERLAVRPEFRHSRLAFKLVRAGFLFARHKGYTRFYGHAQERLLDFWQRFGGRPMKNRPNFTFSDFNYVEMELELPLLDEAIRFGADPYLIIRPEGDWERPGILERSSKRDADSPLEGINGS